METETPAAAVAAATTTTGNHRQKPRNDDKNHHLRSRSIFDVPPTFFDSCRVLQSPSDTTTVSDSLSPAAAAAAETQNDVVEREVGESVIERWTCHTCDMEFDSLQDQRAHFQSDFHRFNIKLRISGKDTVKEEDFDELTYDSLFKDYDISSISGSEDEDDKDSALNNDLRREFCGSIKRKVFIHLHTGERVSVWKCLFVEDSDKTIFENDKSLAVEDNGMPSENRVIEKLRHLIHEPRDGTHLRVVLLARGGHFAGCVFDGNSVVAHKTFHRYVVRAKAGKKQSSKDAGGKIAHSAGASMRRQSELALKKEIRELLSAWKEHFEASSCIFIHAPSNNRQLLFDGEKPYFSCQRSAIRSIPLTVRRPTLKEARRVYSILAQISFELEEDCSPIVEEKSLSTTNLISTNKGLVGSTKEDLQNGLESKETVEASSELKQLEDLSISSESENIITHTSTPLHEAAKSGNVERILELLEQDHDPCIKDERGRTPYMLATEKEVRNTFRRFMSLNLDKWDWHAAKVPSPLTKEMEESQNAKQAEKDAKRKARAKELKKLRKEKEKKAQAEAAQSQHVKSSGATPSSVSQPQPSGVKLSKEEELKRAQDAEREKRAAAAERRIAALQAAAATSSPSNASSEDIKCSCCQVSLAGKIPFHRYNYKYCSTSCMHVHREILEDG